jgi:hypothetical protein
MLRRLTLKQASLLQFAVSGTLIDERERGRADKIDFAHTLTLSHKLNQQVFSAPRAAIPRFAV